MARLGGLMMFGYAGGPPLGAAIGAAASLVRTLHRDPRRHPQLPAAACASRVIHVTHTSHSAQAGLEELRAPFGAGALLTIGAFVFVAGNMPSVEQVKAAKASEVAEAAAETEAAGGGAAKSAAAAEDEVVSTGAYAALGLLMLANIFAQVAAQLPTLAA